MHRSGHIDTFTRDHLPPAEQQPEYVFTTPGLQYPDRMNVTIAFVDSHVDAGSGDAPCLVSASETLSYTQLQERVNRIANVLTRECGLVPGNRVLLRSANTPMVVACIFAVIKAGGVVVATMPMLRAKELAYPITKGRIRLALCDHRLVDELEKTKDNTSDLTRIVTWGDNKNGSLETLMAKPGYEHFTAADTAQDDVCLIGFTSGTTGEPKGTMHFHRDLLAVCDTYSQHVLKPSSEDRFIGSPPLAFTFGLGGLVLFPLRVGASAVLLEAAAPDLFLQAVQQFKPTICFTAPTAYRTMLAKLENVDISSLKKCVSAGEALPRSTFEAWKQATGLELLDGIGATEMLHIFIASPEGHIRPGSTGVPVPGYEAMVIDGHGKPVADGTVGRLAVRGPTGCRYLDDKRQADYVKHGWNITGDSYMRDAQGYFWYQARSDDMIISAGYNIAGPEVEGCLLTHPVIAECGVVGQPDADRGMIVKAYVVLKHGHEGSHLLTKQLQDYVKAEIAPYKYPRAIAYVDSLPRTQTGKLQRFELRSMALNEASTQSLRQGQRARTMAILSSPSLASPSLAEGGGHQRLQPSGWPQPRGYANGIAASGKIVVTGGVVGWNENGIFAQGLVQQVRQALLNIRAILAEANIGPPQLVRLTWYVTDMVDYRASLKELGQVYREVFGKHFPTMALVQVVSLVEPAALVEIEATAVISLDGTSSNLDNLT